MLQNNDQFLNEEYQALQEPSKKTTLLKILAKGFMQIVLMALVLGIAFAATMRLVNTKPEIAKRPIFPTVYTVDTVSANLETVKPVFSLYGEVLAGRSVELRSLVSGAIVLVSDKLKSGGKVEQGEVMLEIDPFTYDGQLREAKANALETQGRLEEASTRVRLEQSRLQGALDQLELAKSDLARITQLRARGTATEKQLEERKLILSQRSLAAEQSEINIEAENAKIRQLQATAERLEWKIEQSVRDLENTKLLAPFSGTIRSSSAEVGKLANANDIQVSMYQSDTLEARFVLTNEQFGRLQADDSGLIDRSVEVIWNVGGINYSFPGSIDRIGAEIASARGGVEVFATIGTAAHSVTMRPGAFVEIKVPDRAYKDHIILPDSALYHGDTVYVVEEGELAERKVSLAAFDGDSVLIASGLQQGEEVLITRISEISAGLKVRKEGDPDPVRKNKPEGAEASGKPVSANTEAN